MSSIRRSRWAAIGAAVAVTLGAGGLTIVNASSAPSSFVSITPVRVLDTRTGVGLSGPFESPTGRTVQITGTVPTASGPAVVVPAGATAVVLNVTAVLPQADGFISVRPDGTPGAPETSSLNFAAGAIVPNSVTVALSAGGAIDVVYDAFGAAGPTTDALIDVVGYTTDTAIQGLVTEMATKANSTDVYTKPETDAALAAKANSTDVYTKSEVDEAIADGPVMSAFGGTIPNPFPTPQGLSGSNALTTTMTSRLHLTVHVGLGLTCSSSQTRFAWLELDDEPLPSSLIRVGGLGQAFSPLTLTGITNDSVPAGGHTVKVRQACAAGSSTASSVVNLRGLVEYIADDGGLSPASVGTLESRSTTACDPPAVEPEPGVCVLTES